MELTSPLMDSDTRPGARSELDFSILFSEQKPTLLTAHILAFYASLKVGLYFLSIIFSVVVLADEFLSKGNCPSISLPETTQI